MARLFHHKPPGLTLKNVRIGRLISHIYDFGIMLPLGGWCNLTKPGNGRQRTSQAGQKRINSTRFPERLYKCACATIRPLDMASPLELEDRSPFFRRVN